MFDAMPRPHSDYLELKHLINYYEKVLGRNYENTNVVLIGHSMGALIAKALACKSENVIAVFSIASAPSKFKLFPLSAWMLFYQHKWRLLNNSSIKLTESQISDFFCNGLSDDVLSKTKQILNRESSRLAKDLFKIQFGVGPKMKPGCRVFEFYSKGDRVCRPVKPWSKYSSCVHKGHPKPYPGHMFLLDPKYARVIIEELYRFWRLSRNSVLDRI